MINAKCLDSLSQFIAYTQHTFGPAQRADDKLVTPTQIHRSNLAGNLVAGSPMLQSFAATASSSLFHRAGLGGMNAAIAALGQLELRLQQQAKVLAYMDCFRDLMCFSIIMLPLAWLFHVSRPAARPRSVS